MIKMTITDVVDVITSVLDSATMPAEILPPLLLKTTALNRPGLSAYKISSQIIENNKKLGIPTENNPDGSDNMINQYTYNIVKCIVDAIKNDATVQVAIPMQSLLIQATGANAGGPVTCVGTNLSDSIGNGILQ
jgi:hypothetical protein